MSKLKKITIDIAPVATIKIDDQPALTWQLIGEIKVLFLCECGNTIFGHFSLGSYEASYCTRCNRHYNEEGDEIQTL